MRYWTSALLSIGRNIARDIGRGSPSRWSFTKQWLSSGHAYDAAPKAASAHFLDLYPEAENLKIDMGHVCFRRSNVTPFEAYCICCIAQLRQPKRLFEFGTFDGATSLLLARSCPAAGVFTLDLDPESAGTSGTDIASEVENVRTGTVGERFRGTPEAGRIRQLFGDSTQFDYAPYQGSIDMVFVDACHDYPYAASDTQAALKIRNAAAVVLWHDYVPGWPGVVKAVDQLIPQHRIWHIAGTALAVLDPAVVGSGRQLSEAT